jgi:hypothetical protein
MKKVFLFIVCCFAALSSFGQSQVTDQGLVYSEGGFKVINMYKSYSDGSRAINCSGLYSSDGKTLVSAFNTYTSGYYVAYGTEVIAKNAFRYFHGTIYLPSTVKYIDPQAFNYLNQNTSYGYSFIIDDAVTKQIDTDSSAKVENTTNDENVEEVARYNIQGQKLDEPEHGINIVKMSDNTAKKELIK